MLAIQPAISVIEEKGEGFENGENCPWLSGVLPSTSALHVAS
jgi:hypothetical protein